MLLRHKLLREKNFNFVQDNPRRVPMEATGIYRMSFPHLSNIAVFPIKIFFHREIHEADISESVTGPGQPGPRHGGGCGGGHPD